jgi:cell division protein FtsZ
MTFDPQETPNPGAIIKVIGVGGGGTNAVSSMINENICGVEFIAANTDIQSLRTSLAPTKIQIGKELTKGLGAGSDPDIGRDAALEDRYEIQEALSGADMVFITAGMGGGTGTGSASVIAQIARELGALTVAVVTKPFSFEGKRRIRHAQMGIEKLEEQVDTLITIPNQKLLQVANPGLSMIEAFQVADQVLVNAVKGISNIINIPGTINVDFADVKTIMSSTGQALMGIGTSSAENRALEAAKQAISSPLLEDIEIEGATGILMSITAGENISLLEVNEACTIIQEAAHEDANIIFGTVIDPSLGDEIKITLIATGFPNENNENITTVNSNRIFNPASIGKKSVFRPIVQKPKEKKLLSQPQLNKNKVIAQPQENLASTEKEAEKQTIPLPQEDQRSSWSQFSFDDLVEKNTQQEASDSDKNPQTKDSTCEKQEQQNIEEEIDAALQLSDKLDQHINLNEEDLDIPTFLRKKNTPTFAEKKDDEPSKN